MSKKNLILIVSIFIFQKTYSNKDINHAAKIENAIASNSYYKIEKLLAETKNKNLLNEKLKKAILVFACKAVQEKKEQVTSIFGLKLDNVKLRNAIILTILGIGGMLGGPEILNMQYVRPKSGLYTDDSDEVQTHKKNFFATRSFIGNAMEAVGPVCFFFATIEMIKAYMQLDLAEARLIKQQIKKELFGIEPKKDA